MAQAMRPALVAMRRHPAMHPELSGQGRGTARMVAALLARLGLEVRTGMGGHGVVGLLRGGLPGDTIAWRADMDVSRPIWARGMS